MTLVLCIGFHYQERLPALIDITAVQPLLAARPGSRTVVVSDQDPRDRCAISALASHDGRDEDLCARVQLLQKNYLVCNDAETLRGILRAEAGQDTVLYYSGHNDSTGMIMPDGGHLPWTELLGELRCLSLVAVLDCCRCPRLSLPFAWSKGAWRFKPGEGHEYRSSLLLLICCSSEQEETFSSSIGSPFTRQLASWLEGADRGFSALEELYPRIHIYSSLPTRPCWD